MRLAILVLLLMVVGVFAAVATGGGDRHSTARAGHATAARPAEKKRAHRPPTAMQRVVSWAREHDGMHEIGTTNCSPAIARWERHMGLAVPAAPPCRPWCGAFLHEAYLQAGIHLSSRLIDPNESYTDAVDHRNGLKAVPKASVRPGDIVFFELDPGVQASHAAIVVGRPRHGKVRTAEGNVGHHVVVVRRGLRYVVLAARVTRKPSGHGAAGARAA